MKNQMAKRIASVLLAGVMLVSLAACGENKRQKKRRQMTAKEQQERDRDPGIHRSKPEHGYDRACKRVQRRSSGSEDHI